MKTRTPEQLEQHRKEMRERYHSNPVVRARMKATASAWNATPEAKIKRTARRLGVPDETVAALRAIGRCQACGDTPSRNREMSIDHDHVTGRVRGLLCDPCNMALGLLGTTERIEGLLRYMNKVEGNRLTS